VGAESAAIPAAAVDALRRIVGPGALWLDVPLARYTAFQIGGPADLLVVARDVDALRQVVTLAWERRIFYRVLGKGSNILVSDAGWRGLVVLNRARETAILPPRKPEGSWTVRAESGALFSTLARRCVDRGLAGLEWAVGIPGTVGGAVVGNAGAWGGDVASSLQAAAVLEPGGGEARWPVERFGYAYRTSILKTEAERRQAVVLAAEFGLREGEPQALRARAAEIAARRKASQPSGTSCGSVFKNPPGDSAGRLIEAAGLKGRRVGGAQISTRHANFIINLGQARAADVKALIDLARATVRERFGVALELEIELVGDWGTERP